MTPQGRAAALEYVQQFSTPEGLNVVRDDAVADVQVRGLMLHNYGEATRGIDGNPFMLSEAGPGGQPIALKDLPNDPQNPVHGRTDAKGNPIGFRDWTIDILRRQKNQHTYDVIDKAAQKIFYGAQDRFGTNAGRLSKEEAWQMAVDSTAEGQAPTVRHQVMQDTEFDTKYPELAGAKIREHLQSLITERSPYNKEDVQRDWLAKEQQGQAEMLQSLINRKGVLQGDVNTLGTVEAARDVTKGLAFNSRTLENVKTVKSDAESRKVRLKAQLEEFPRPAGQQSAQYDALLKEYNHNDGIIQQANGYINIWDEEAWWGGRGDTVGDNSRNMENAGRAARLYQTYQDADKTTQTREITDMNLGRRDFYRTLHQMQAERRKNRELANKLPKSHGTVPR
jgi:hypothetical protein